MRVAILGCGYVGLALGRRLRERGHGVVGLRRSAAGVESVESAGLEAVRGDVTDPEALAAVGDVDAAVFAASAGGRDAAAARAVYVDGLGTAVEALGDRPSPPERLVYTSSTGVYGDHGGDWVDEGTELRPETDRERALVEAERVARGAADHGIEPVVARLGGLYGPDRYRLERYLEGPVAEGWLNQVHRDDAAGAVRFLLERDPGAAPETVLVVDDEPAWKPEFAAWLAERCGVAPPAVREDAGSRRGRAQKRCSNARLRGLGYELRYPTYREGYRDAVEAYAG